MENPIIVVDLSKDDEIQIARNEADKRKWKDLKKYIPFLKYVATHARSDNAKLVQLLNWLETREQISVRMALICEEKIRQRYHALKLKVKFPPEIVEIFRETIVISDDDDEPQPLKNRPSSSGVVNRTPQSLSSKVEQKAEGSTSSTSKEKKNTRENILSQITLKNSPALPKSRSSSADKEKQTANDENKTNNRLTRTAPEDGELLSDGGDMDLLKDKSDDSTHTLSDISITDSPKRQVNSGTCKEIELDDDAINDDLFNRIDKLAADSPVSKRNAEPSWKELEKEAQTPLQNSPVLKQNNKSDVTPLRKSPEPPVLVLSPVSDEDESRFCENKKKRKKHKRKKKANHETPEWCLSEVENNSGKSQTIKQKFRRRNTEASEGPDSKSKKKHRKRRETTKPTRLLIVSDDDEDTAPISTTTPAELPKRNDTELFQRREPLRNDKPESNDSSNQEPVTVILLDSDEDEGHKSSVIETKSGKLIKIDTETVSPPSTSGSNSPPVSSSVDLQPATSATSTVTSEIKNILPQSNASEEVKKNIEEPENFFPLSNLEGLGLTELNELYSNLCKYTGITLEKYLGDLVVASATESKPIPPTNQQDIPFDLDQNPSNDNFDRNFAHSPDDFGYQQHQENIQYQQHFEQQAFMQQQQQLQHQHQLQQHHMQQQYLAQQQHQSFQMSNQMHCNLQVPYPYENNRCRPLRMNDPRIVQKLKQIQDSPFHNMAIRESAALLVNNLHAPRPQNYQSQVTSKTASTYGEHKRLRELEKQRKLDLQNAKKYDLEEASENTITEETSNSTAGRKERKNSSASESGRRTPKTVESESSKNKKTAKPKRKNSSGSESGRKTPKSVEQENNEDGTTTARKTKRTNSSGSDSGRKTPKSVERQNDEDGTTTARKTKRANSSGSDSGRKTPKLPIGQADSENDKSNSTTTKRKMSSSLGDFASTSQSAVSDESEERAIMSFSLNRSARLRIESSSSDEEISVPDVTPPAKHTSSRCVTPERRDKLLKYLSSLDKEILNTTNGNVQKQKSSENISKSESSRDENKLSLGRKRKRANSQVRDNTSKAKTSQAKRGCRELNNLNCTLLDYREMFEKNQLETIDGKRRCRALTISKDCNFEDDNFSQKSDEAFFVRSKSFTKDDCYDGLSSRNEFRAAPIQRRRQTCISFQRTSPERNEQLLRTPLKVVIRRLSEDGSFGVKVDNKIQREKKNELGATQNKESEIRAEVKIVLKRLSITDTDKPIKIRGDIFDGDVTSSRRLTMDKEVVKEKRLSSELLVENTKDAEEREMPRLLPMTSEDMSESPSKSSSKVPKYANVDKHMTLRSTKVCAICNRKPAELTNHYVSQHKTESYISRLTSAEIDRLEANITLAVASRKSYTVDCAFCQQELKGQFVSFHAHYSIHTGEYGYVCDGCDIKKPFREDIRSHQLHSFNTCMNKKIRTNYLYSPDLTVIYLHVCTLCNFVQLNEANVHKHQRDHHGFSGDQPEYVKKCIIAALDNGEVANEVLSGNVEEEQHFDEQPNRSESLDCREQDFKVEPELDISIEPLEIKAETVEFENLLKELHNEQEMVEEKAVPSPEALLAQIHAPATSSPNLMTVIHYDNTLPCQESHQPLVECVDVKPKVSELLIEPPKDVKPQLSKARKTFRQYNDDVPYFGMHKCVHDDCWFSTNVGEKLIEHMKTHSNKIFQYNCAYCAVRHASIEQLVKHVRARHGYNLYQCSECCYRSISPGNVIMHKEIFHNTTNGIYICAGRKRDVDDMRLMKQKLFENVKSLKCTDCSSQFYALSSIKSHIQKEHPHSSSILNDKIFTEFSCIYCRMESNSKETLQAHLATEHPDEMPFLAERRLENESCADAAENLNIVNVSLPIMLEDIRQGICDENQNDVTPSAQGDKKPISVEATQEEKSIFERLKLLLDVFTENTGVNRSTLYRCSVCDSSFFQYELWLTHVRNRHNIKEATHCPYCAKKVTLDLAAGHFGSHCHHKHVCYHCVMSFSSKQQIGEHFVAHHKECQEFKEKAIIHGTDRYFIYTQQNVSILNWVSELQHFAEAVAKKCGDRLLQNTDSEWLHDTLPACIEEVNIPQYIDNGQPRYRCVLRACPFVGEDESALDNHINEHTVPRFYKCTPCDIELTEPSWEQIKNHGMLHKDTLYICCVCKFVHHRRANVTQHIEFMHNSRDVPVLSISRGASTYKTSLAIVLASGKTAFTTTSACFCCNLAIRNSTKLVKHLRAEHKITLCRTCEECGKTLMTLTEAKLHTAEHGQSNFKLNYKVLTTFLHNATVTSLSPFAFEVKPKKQRRADNDSVCLPLKKPKLEPDLNIKIKEEVIVKSEVVDDEPMEDVSPGISLKCKNINQLVNQDAIGIANGIQIPTNLGGIFVKSPALLQMASPAENSVISAPHQHPHFGMGYPTSFTANQYDATNELVAPTPVNQYYQRPLPQPSMPVPITINVSLPNNQGTAIISQAAPPVRVNTPKQRTLLPRPVTSYQPNTLPRATSSTPYNSSTRQAQTNEAIKQGSNPFSTTTPLNSGLTITVPKQAIINTVVSQAVPARRLLGTPPQTSTLAQKPESIDSVVNQAAPTRRLLGTPPRQQTQLRRQSTTSTASITQQSEPIDGLVAEILPICEICKKECNDFSHLKEHFEAVHAVKKNRFLFRLARKIACAHCSYRGSLSSLPAHNSRFHPKQDCLCNSVLDADRCGLCDQKVLRQLNAKGNVIRTCSCPLRERVLADCLDLKTLSALEVFGIKFNAFACKICRQTFHFSKNCSQHIADAHKRKDMQPELMPITYKLYLCSVCDKTTRTVQEVIEHIRITHFGGVTSNEPMDRMAVYNKIGVIHPLGLIVFMSDLRNANSSDEKAFKRAVQCVEAQYQLSSLSR